METNVFQLVSIGTSLGDVFGEDSIMDEEEMKSVALQVGKDTSQLIKVLLGIKSHSSSSQRHHHSLEDFEE